MKYALAVLATLAVLGLLAVLFPFTGIYNVSAAEGHTGLGEWFLNTTSTRSIKARADDVAAPADLSDPDVIARGAVAYGEMCQTCHGGPGAERSVIGEGLTPTPPHLSEAASEWTPGEVYWILDEGIKMAGMPAFGETHSEEELWELVAFVESLPETTPERYAELTAPTGGESADSTGGARASDGHDHVH